MRRRKDARSQGGKQRTKTNVTKISIDALWPVRSVMTIVAFPVSRCGPGTPRQKPTHSPVAEGPHQTIAARSARAPSKETPGRGGRAATEAVGGELTCGPLHLAKTLYEPSRQELSELGPAREAWAKHLQATGARRHVTPL